tara:strand:- start:312 stop:1526 length:1215 start_codon:yes stop_codon:yes gene_type:complete
MNFFFDKRLGYLVKTPGLDTPLESLEVKAGDGLEVNLQYGTSPDSSVPSSVITAPSWTAESLPGGATMTLGIKAEGDYSDGDLLTSTSSWTHDASTDTYTAELDLNTTEINTPLARDDADDTNDVPAIENAQLELTFKESSGGKPRSSVNDVIVTIKHDILLGGEGTPTNAGDPDEYLLKTEGIEFLSTVSSQVGGTSADLDSVITTTRVVGDVVSFVDSDSSDQFRVYRLSSGTDAESAPEIIRPDDYASGSNEKIWKALDLSQDSASADKYICTMYLDTDLTSNAIGVVTKIDLDAGEESISGMLDDTVNNRIDIVKSGYYQVCYQAWSASNTSQMYAYVRKNGSNVLSVTALGSNDILTPGGSGILNLSAGDYLELAFLSFTSNSGAGSGSSKTFLHVSEI